MTTDPNKGRLLGNRYKLVELVGQGAMGRVYLAKDMLLGGVLVAVKFISQSLLNKRMRERFEREATICALLGEESIHIVRVRDCGIDENQISFYVMEYLEGESLSEIIRRQPLDVHRFLRISRQICLGLQRAHQGIIFDGQLSTIIHRDIKPSNILVIKDDYFIELVKILDFGIAKLLQSDIEQTHSFMGTLAYCSPEQMEGRELDRRSDIYSLGVMMFEMLTGEMPILAESRSFGGWYNAHYSIPPKSFESVRPDLILPRPLKKLVISCLAKDPKDRPQSAIEIINTLTFIENSLSRGREIAEQWGGTIKQVPVNRQQAKTKLSIDEICRRTSWPKNKPQQCIVFPHLIGKDKEMLATLWVMLNQEDIQSRKRSTRYNQFLCVMSPHPMVLWITALHNSEYGIRWLPCYLDLKTPMGQKTIRLLGKAGQYRILFFALSEPEQCNTAMTSTIASVQRKRLTEWANASNTVVTTGLGHRSKMLLKQEYEKLKPKILMKLEAVYSDYPTDLSSN